MTTAAAAPKKVPSVSVKILDINTKRVLPETHKAAIRFLYFTQPVACAECSARTHSHWTMTCTFSIKPKEDSEPSGKQHLPLTPVCRKHILLPAIKGGRLQEPWEVRKEAAEVSRQVAADQAAASEQVQHLLKEQKTYAGSLLPEGCDSLDTAILKYERALIASALAYASGSVTRAAPVMGMSYQGLAYAINSRHPSLLKERSPIKKRRRSIIRR